jgi:hypothetical protein
MTQTSPVCRCASSRRSYHLLSIHSLKLLMTHFMHRIPRVYHVIHSIILPSSVKRSKCYLHESSLFLFNRSTFQRRVTSIHFFLKPCLKVTHIYPPDHIQKKTYQGFWRSEVHVLSLRIRFVRQDLSSVHSFENVPVHEEVNGIQPVPSPRLPMTCNIHPFLKPCLKISLIYPTSAYRKHPIRDFGVPRFMFRVYGFVRQDLSCMYSDGFGSCFLILVCFFNDYRWSTIHTFLFVSFA